MTRQELTTASKFLSLVLRHQPELLGLQLRPEGWVAVEELLSAAERHGRPIGRELLDRIVQTSDKQRFAFNEDRTLIRANQGHSVETPISYDEADPPPRLFHGTAAANLESIRQHGLLRGKRQYVHLSRDEDTARQVGGRHGKPVVLVVHAERMARSGVKFFLSPNGVWLTDHVPASCLEYPA
ncbi:RNA 2'-phosphotransferase [Ramlibacter sp. XY19]|uniref:RNA 2'-phosphotransferase n=1 Tax=Ramlibacter paludis TaxID=2908000 RepID=UPI0023DA7C84|nr:RNA 2'-phosphotransferase [Ramlibacter paludis]MCG2595412.1 RNA 2'-phosphotransferase [Ramlibacter paludis]